MKVNSMMNLIIKSYFNEVSKKNIEFDGVAGIVFQCLFRLSVL